MSDDEKKSTTSSAGCYLPIIGIIVSIYNIFTNKKNDPYCRFHSYHSLFLWIAVSFIAIIVNLLCLIISPIPFLGPFLLRIADIAMTLFYGGIVVYGIFCAYNAYQGLSFSIPYITEFTNKYLEDKKLLP